MTKIIGIIQVKGGAGRSTLSTNLAGELSKLGACTLIDCDMPQGTSASWYAMRQQAGKDRNLRIATASGHRELVEKIQEHQADDFIILDGPPRIAEVTRVILGVADLVIVPVGASLAELWATSDVLTLLEEARQMRQVEARMVWTRYRPNTRIAQDLTEAAKGLNLPPMNATLGFRVAYPEALGGGLTAAEMSEPNARNEVQALAKEVASILKKVKA